MATTIFDGLDAVRAAVGGSFGPSDWTTLTQERVDAFVQATGDPSGGTSVPETLLLAVSNELLPQIIEVRGISMGVNYGVDAVRYSGSVQVGSRVRAAVGLVEVTEVTGGVQTRMLITIQAEGATEPACTINSLSRFFP